MSELEFYCPVHRKWHHGMCNRCETPSMQFRESRWWHWLILGVTAFVALCGVAAVLPWH